jgi:flavin-dependent dehydrogenase
VIPIGKAAAAIEPIGGEGMGLALRSAELAATAIIGARDGRTIAVGALRGEFNRLWRLRQIACRIGGVALSSPRIWPIAQMFASHWEAAAATTLRWIGKTPASSLTPEP